MCATACSAFPLMRGNNRAVRATTRSVEPFCPQKQAQVETAHQLLQRLSTLDHHNILTIYIEKLKIPLPVFKVHQAFPFVSIKNALEVNVSTSKVEIKSFTQVSRWILTNDLKVIHIKCEKSCVKYLMFYSAWLYKILKNTSSSSIKHFIALHYELVNPHADLLCFSKHFSKVQGRITFLSCFRLFTDVSGTADKHNINNCLHILGVSALLN